MEGREPRDSNALIPLLAGMLLLTAAVALGVFVLPIAPDPRPRKPMDGVTERTTYWDKWAWERHAQQARQRENQAPP